MPNASTRIKNPLAGIPRQRLLQNVEEFAQQHDLTHITDVLKRGALVAQDPANFDTVEGLQDDEREALRNEVVHKCMFCSHVWAEGTLFNTVYQGVNHVPCT